MMNPYETLGVPKDAGEAQIKSAYKNKARKAHPDRKGGNADTMSQLNIAKDILLSPSRRHRYDTGGETTREKTIDEEAISCVMQIFSQLIQMPQRINIPKVAMMKLEEIRGKKRHEQSEAKKQREVIKQRISEVLYEGDGENLFDNLVRSMIGQLDEAIEKLEREIEIVKRAHEIVKLYKSTLKENVAQNMPQFVGIEALAAFARQARY
jgi:curved DNA-binding protein CbpA